MSTMAPSVEKVVIDGPVGAIEAMIERAGAFTAVADETKNHVGAMAQHGALNTQALLAELEDIRKAGRSYKEARIFETIPVVAGWTAAEAAAKREHIQFRISSFDARNQDNEPAKGSFREEQLRELEAQVESGKSEILAKIDHKEHSLHYMRAIRLTDDCLLCHGNPGPQNDPDGDGRDIVGFPFEGWKAGKMHGAYEVIIPLAHMEEQVAGFITSGLMWTGPLVVGGAFFFIYALRVMFNRPVAALIERIRDIAEGEGDLTQRVAAEGKDELSQLGKWFNQFVQKIHDIIVEVGGSANEVASAATEIAASSEEMAQGMNEQTAQVGQVSSAAEEMSASVVEVAQKSTEAATNATSSGATAEEGGKIVNQTIAGMQAINEAVSAGAASVTELGKRSEQIGKIVEVINDIADQTNLLALNAAIEAARAGEHGRGFAVVADEVRKLADRTTKATEEIASSIQAIQDETKQAVDRMMAGTEQVTVGVERATEAGRSLDRIVLSAKQVADMIQSIAAASEEQSAASEQISRSIENISAVSRQATEGANQAASAATQLSRKAESLQSLVGRFKTDRTKVGTNH